jgi:molecular chaperone DnaK
MPAPDRRIPPIGIDLGTTYSVLAQVNPAGQAVVIPNSEGGRITPSVVYLGSAPPLVGEQAKTMQAAGEPDVASFFKRSMGNSSFVVHAAGRDWTPTDLSALVLARLRADGEAALGGAIRECVITVPAYFQNTQREATLEAGQRAGLEVMLLINEPTAAALAYGLHRAGAIGKVLVYDLGGGTFDVTLVEITASAINVVASSGDSNLGGKDWDDRLAVYLCDRFADRHGSNPLDGDQFNEILVRAERAKRELTARDSTRVVIDYHGQRETVEVTRAVFADLCRDLLERTGQLTADMLAEQKMNWGNLKGVLLVGGSTRMPMVPDFLAGRTGQPPMSGVHVDEAVALGAAVQAALELNTRYPTPIYSLPSARPIKDVTAHTLGVIAETSDRSRFVNSPIIQRNMQVPANGEKEYAIHRRGGDIECIVYVTEGDGTDPKSVAVRGRYVCRGRFSGPEPLARVAVRYAYDRSNTIQVSARLIQTNAPLEVVQEPASDMGWLSKSPRELETFDPATLDLVVSPPCYDDIGSILGSLKLTHRPHDGLPAGDILFLNCGSPILPAPAELRRYVEQGGCVYASDLTDELVAAAFPGVLQLAGHVGQSGMRVAEVVDAELRTRLGKSLQVHFDLGGWAELGGVGSEVRVLLQDQQSKRPLMVQAAYGEGKIFFTCFHNRTLASETERSLLQLLVAKQISAVSGFPIEVVTRATGLAIRSS